MYVTIFTYVNIFTHILKRVHTYIHPHNTHLKDELGIEFVFGHGAGSNKLSRRRCIFYFDQKVNVHRCRQEPAENVCVSEKKYVQIQLHLPYQPLVYWPCACVCARCTHVFRGYPPQ